MRSNKPTRVFEVYEPVYDPADSRYKDRDYKGPVYYRLRTITDLKKLLAFFEAKHQLQGMSVNRYPPKASLPAGWTVVKDDVGLWTLEKLQS